MSILSTDLRNKRNQIFLGPTPRDIASYYTDSTKRFEMKETFCNELFLGNFHPHTDLLNKNLAETLVNQQQGTEMNANETKMSNTEYSKLSGITNFISGVFSIVSSVMFKRPKSPENSFDRQTTTPSWQPSKPEYKNDCELNFNTNKSDLVMPDSKIETSETNIENQKRFAMQSVEHSDPEDCFEDALCLEPNCLLNSNVIEYYSPLQHHKDDYYQVDAPKIKLEGQVNSLSRSVVNDFLKITLAVPEKTNEDTPPQENVNSTLFHSEKSDTVQNMNKSEELNVPEQKINNDLVTSCESKMNSLKALLQSRCKNNSCKETKNVPLKLTKPIPIAKDKHYKNPNRVQSKRMKTNMKQMIAEDMSFPLDVYFDYDSSVEDSPSFQSVEICLDAVPCNSEPEEYFDEITGRFQTNHETCTGDAFEIVFSDIPKRVRSTSECESEDSFIVFADSPDNCYTTNEVFGDSSSSDYDSDSNESGSVFYGSLVSDASCGSMKLAQCMTRTVSNLADDSLYDEVDCASVPNSAEVRDNVPPLFVENAPAEKQKRPCKKVHFSPLPPKVHVMRVWAFAARQARAGHWERYALDRERFKRRIADTDMALSWVLKPQHRSRIMFQRFMPWWNAEKRRELAEKKEKEDNANKEALEQHETENINGIQHIEQNETDRCEDTKIVDADDSLDDFKMGEEIKVQATDDLNDTFKKYEVETKLKSTVVQTDGKNKVLITNGFDSDIGKDERNLEKPQK